ncbi:hypothetical protein F4774DRAFT_403208 [Daldinia eschscholtzii]|nr:hypothetical protein F4774DRAFT_403208 [Daldinia eschscholtzii]
MMMMMMMMLIMFVAVFWCRVSVFLRLIKCFYSYEYSYELSKITFGTLGRADVTSREHRLIACNSFQLPTVFSRVLNDLPPVLSKYLA